MSRQFHALAICELRDNTLLKDTALITGSVKFLLHSSQNREKGSNLY